MSAAVVEQVKQLIDELSVNEKVGLVEWLGATLGRELAATSVKRKKRSKAAQAARSAAPVVNGDVGGAAVAAIEEEERPWTEDEIRELMKPDPKTGAEIVAMLEQLDLREWQEMDIPDVVEWLKKQRHEEAVRRGIYWDDSE
jgi:hypothetical protein